MGLGQRALCVCLFLVVSACGGVDSTSPSTDPSSSAPPAPAEESPELLFSLNLYSTPSAQHIQRMSQAADAVVVGTVKNISSRWETGETGAPLIYSYIQVEVEESYKGNVNPILVVRNVGGTVGDRMLTVSHVPNFRHVGEKTLLFLKKDKGHFKVPFSKPSKILIHNEENLSFLDQDLSLEAVRTIVLEGTP